MEILYDTVKDFEDSNFFEVSGVHMENGKWVVITMKDGLRWKIRNWKFLVN